MSDKIEMLEDPKVQAVMSLVNEISESSFSNMHKEKVLTFIEKRAMLYVLNELPEGASKFWYTTELDNFMIKNIKEIK